VTSDELDTLRTKLRYAVQAEQIRINVIGKGCGLSVNELSAFLYGAIPLGPQEALQLHSYLHYRNADEEEKVRKRTAQEPDKFHHRYKQFQALRIELKRGYGLIVEYEGLFKDRTVREQQAEIRELDRACKRQLLKMNPGLKIKLSDGHTYWQWKAQVEETRERA